MNSNKDVDRRNFLKQTSMTLSGLLLTGGQQISASPSLRPDKKTDKPNILFIITDHYAYYGHFDTANGKFGMPYTESLAKEGIFFKNAYCVQPLCSPARASMMSGVYPSKHGMRWNTGASRSEKFARTEFKPEQKLYSHFLSQAGYRNGYFGKWHCAETKTAADYGFEGWSLPDYGKIYMSDAYKDYCRKRGLGDATALIEHSVNHPKWEGTKQVLHHKSTWRFMNNSGILQGPKEAHEENFVANLAIEKLHEFSKSKQPFSMTVSFWGPHHAYFPSEEYAGKVDPSKIKELANFRDDYAKKPHRHIEHRDHTHEGKNRWRNNWPIWQSILARCYEQMLQIDDAIKDVVETLKKLGLYDNTIIIFCADHGDSVASRGGLWDKSSTYTEEVARVPMFVRFPKKIKEPYISDKLVSNMDTTATILDAAGVEVPEYFDSRSLLELVDNPNQWRDVLVSEHNGKGDKVLERIAIKGNYKYVAALPERDELYDLKNDPNEFVNLVDDKKYQHVKQQMQQELIRHMEENRTYEFEDEDKLLEKLRLAHQS